VTGRKRVDPAEFGRLVGIASRCTSDPGAAMKLARTWARRLSTNEPIGPEARSERVSNEDRHWLAGLSAPAVANMGERA
jgi:hypothetical protein